MRRTWENLFTEAGVDPPRARVTSRSLLAIRALLLEGDYLALLNLGQVALDVDNGLISIIGAPLPDASIPVGITYRTGWEPTPLQRSEEHTSELQSLMRISYAVFCLKQKTHKE